MSRARVLIVRVGCVAVVVHRSEPQRDGDFSSIPFERVFPNGRGSVFSIQVCLRQDDHRNALDQSVFWNKLSRKEAAAFAFDAFYFDKSRCGDGHSLPTVSSLCFLHRNATGFCSQATTFIMKRQPAATCCCGFADKKTHNITRHACACELQVADLPTWIANDGDVDWFA